MYRPGSVTRPAFCHVILLTTDHFSFGSLRPYAGPERFTGSHFEGVELQGERRQRQPQTLQFLGPRIMPAIRGARHVW